LVTTDAAQEMVVMVVVAAAVVVRAVAAIAPYRSRAWRTKECPILATNRARNYVPPQVHLYSEAASHKPHLDEKEVALVSLSSI
jgi:hypothetical protein